MTINRLDEEAYWEEKVHVYADMVLRLALTYMKNKTDAQDICQDVFLKLLRQGRRFSDEEHEKAWILRVTINACKDALRSPWRRRVAPLTGMELPIGNSEGREMVEQVLALPSKYRVTVYLHYFENYRTAEIAELLGKNENTIRTWLKRARELLRTKLDGGEGNG
ncbi:sigma-70 family RNA polymerase sigma factor [Gorillibacterium massiliense]|uniref:sigma-70 family RNA polymerase sigma factor n=1 Tax=Gorillibacterium massiliense TaxID=1280390 RepID=UPI0004B9AE3B|nr:sigma-70 family RNA polymerase sigma factor [Gorillibacterium massiliense]